VELPSEVLDAVGEVNENNCSITITPDSKLEIKTPQGKKYTVEIPPSSLSGVAELLNAKVNWSEQGENFNTDDVKPTEPIDLGTATGIITVDKVDVKYEGADDEKFKADFGREIALSRTNPNHGETNRTSGVTGIENQERWPTRGGVIIDETNLKRTERYVNLLKEDVSNGGILSDTNRKNLQEI